MIDITSLFHYCNLARIASFKERGPQALSESKHPWIFCILTSSSPSHLIHCSRSQSNSISNTLRWNWEARWECDLITSIQSPGNAVEFEVDAVDLIFIRDCKEVESLNWVFCCANTVKSPVPDDPGAASDVELEGVDPRDRRSGQDACNVTVLATITVVAELSM